MLLKAVCLNGLIIICNPDPLCHTYFLLSCIKEQQTGADLVLGDMSPFGRGGFFICVFLSETLNLLVKHKILWN